MKKKIAKYTFFLEGTLFQNIALKISVPRPICWHVFLVFMQRDYVRKPRKFLIQAVSEKKIASWHLCPERKET